MRNGLLHSLLIIGIILSIGCIEVKNEKKEIPNFEHSDLRLNVSFSSYNLNNESHIWLRMDLRNNGNEYIKIVNAKPIVVIEDPIGRLVSSWVYSTNTSVLFFNSVIRLEPNNNMTYLHLIDEYNYNLTESGTYSVFCIYKSHQDMLPKEKEEPVWEGEKMSRPVLINVTV